MRCLTWRATSSTPYPGCRRWGGWGKARVEQRHAWQLRVPRRLQRRRCLQRIQRRWQLRQGGCVGTSRWWRRRRRRARSRPLLRLSLGPHRSCSPRHPTLCNPRSSSCPARTHSPQPPPQPGHSFPDCLCIVYLRMLTHAPHPRPCNGILSRAPKAMSASLTVAGDGAYLGDQDFPAGLESHFVRSFVDFVFAGARADEAPPRSARGGARGRRGGERPCQARHRVQGQCSSGRWGSLSQLPRQQNQIRFCSTSILMLPVPLTSPSPPPLPWPPLHQPHTMGEVRNDTLLPPRVEACASVLSFHTIPY